MLRVLQASPLGKVLRYWDAIQVELHGRYSLSRLHTLKYHKTTSSWPRNIATVGLTPLPCLVVVTAIDMLPVNLPHLGFWKQTPWFLFRIAFLGWIVSWMVAMQIHNSSPTLPLSTKRLCIISFAAAVTCAVAYSLLGIVIAFPTPFGLQLITGPWVVTFTLGLYLSWKHALRSDVVARENLRRYTAVFGVQVAIVFVYTGYNIAFTSVHGDFQTYVAFCLPLIKLTFKNIVSRGVYHMEDLAPMTIVFNVDVFHALFVSSTMRQAKTGGSVTFVMIVDVVQAVIAIYEVQNVVVRIRRNVARIGVTENTGASTKHAPQEPARLRSLGLIDYALEILATHGHIHNHPQVTQPRHVRALTSRRSSNRLSLTITERYRSLARRVSLIAPSAVSFHLSAPSHISTSALPPVATKPIEDPAAAPLPKLSSADQIRLRIVEDVLKLLHMVEFYVLIEFAEFLIAAVYTLYMLVMNYLPTRAFYVPLAVLTRAEMAETIQQVAEYAAMELLSFVLFCVIHDSTLRWRISAIQQLAFVLQTHARVLQATLVMWVFFVAQLTFEHLGTDYTFKIQTRRGAPVLTAPSATDPWLPPFDLQQSVARRGFQDSGCEIHHFSSRFHRK